MLPRQSGWHAWGTITHHHHMVTCLPLHLSRMKILYEKANRKEIAGPTGRDRRPLHCLFSTSSDNRRCFNASKLFEWSAGPYNPFPMIGSRLTGAHCIGTHGQRNMYLKNFQPRSFFLFPSHQLCSILINTHKSSKRINSCPNFSSFLYNPSLTVPTINLNHGC
jgi:hypothetical protein